MTETSPSQKRYPRELKDRAVHMVLELKQADPGDITVIGRVARQLGVGKESLRSWVKRAEIDTGARPGTTSTDQGEIAELRKENRELRRANEILQAAASFFGAELDRRSKK
jgi:transposase